MSGTNSVSLWIEASAAERDARMIAAAIETHRTRSEAGAAWADAAHACLRLAEMEAKVVAVDEVAPFFAAVETCRTADDVDACEIAYAAFMATHVLEAWQRAVQRLVAMVPAK
jgi:hypothetical protein